MRIAQLTVFILATAALAAGCDDEPAPGATTNAVIDAWKRADMTATEFAPHDGKDLADGVCQAGRVDGLHIIVCEYPDAKAAEAAHDAGLKVVGNATGAALPSGNRLLIVADRDKIDPSGRAIQKLTRVYLHDVDR